MIKELTKTNDIKINLEPTIQVVLLNMPVSKNSYGGKLLGRTLGDWVKFACSGYPISTAEFDKNESVINIAKKAIDKSFDYTILLLSNTPLLQPSDIERIVEYATTKRVNLCKLPVGYVFCNRYVLESSDLQVDSVYSWELDNFYIVENKGQFVHALDVLQDRISKFHMNNNVELINPKSIYIEPDVDIERGVVIYSNNILKGTSYIDNDAILKENNIIEDSVIGSGSCLSASKIVSSHTGKNVYIGSFCEIIDSNIASDCTIGAHCSLINFKTAPNTKIPPNSALGDTNDSDNRTGKSG